MAALEEQMKSEQASRREYQKETLARWVSESAATITPAEMRSMLAAALKEKRKKQHGDFKIRPEQEWQIEPDPKVTPVGTEALLCVRRLSPSSVVLTVRYRKVKP